MSKEVGFGTFKGVFVPTFLTILGIILFLRIPWVVGTTGLFGAFLILLISIGITLSTTLSLSSIVTNMKIGAGGAFSIISRSLGLEIGGSIGIPLYLAQAVAVAMYIFGFREGWLWIFPDHSPIIVDCSAFFVILILAFISTNLAFRLQYIILGIVLLAIASVAAGLLTHPVNEELVTRAVESTSYPEYKGFWFAFAVFFPAVTGIMAGLNMSGELANPRQSIPRGTLWAVAITSVIYLGLMIVASGIASQDDLVSHYTIFISRSYWKPIVLLGLLGATFSSALTSFVGAPRVLQAIAEKEIMPFQSFLSQKSKTGEPRNAILITGAIVLVALLLRELNVIAPLLTMFFLITYAMINVVVLIEQTLSLPSFRPTFSIPIYIPLVGTVGSFVVMFIINPVFSLIAVVTVVAIYIYLTRKKLPYGGGYARSGLFTAIAEWATKKSKDLAGDRELRAWQPDLLIPISRANELKSAYKMIYSIVHPKGSVKVMGVGNHEEQEKLRRELPPLIEELKRSDISATWSLVDGENFWKSVEISMEALGAAFFKPNSLFIRLDRDRIDLDAVDNILHVALEHRWGVMIFVPHDKSALGMEKSLNLWLWDIPDDWEDRVELGNNDLALITTLLIKKNWKAKLNVIMLASENESGAAAMKKLERIKSVSRLPSDATLLVRHESSLTVESVPSADLNITSTNSSMDVRSMIQRSLEMESSFLFLLDSGTENAQV